MRPLSVCCVMLIDGRPEMVRRAVRCFQEQDYAGPKHLLAFNTGPEIELDTAVVYNAQRLKGKPIGALRNAAQTVASRLLEPDVMLIFDSDDWSHPSRIREQVSLLQDSMADVVGYNRILAWDPRVSEAWLYNQPCPHYVTGNTMCYWRRVGDAKPFPELAHGSDTIWIQSLKVRAADGVSNRGEQMDAMLKIVPAAIPLPMDPRFVMSIHGANTTARIEREANEWSRAPHWDAYCRVWMES